MIMYMPCTWPLIKGIWWDYSQNYQGFYRKVTVNFLESQVPLKLDPGRKESRKSRPIQAFKIKLKNNQAEVLYENVLHLNSKSVCYFIILIILFLICEFVSDLLVLSFILQFIIICRFRNCLHCLSFFLFLFSIVC